MLWSDSIFTTPPDRQKLHWLIHAITHAYLGDLQLHLPPGASQLVAQTGGDLPISYTYVQDGQKIGIVCGTTHPGEYLSQSAGYVAHSPYVHGGRVNTLYSLRTEAIYDMWPNDVSLIAGHSSGGAIAVLLGRKLADAGLPLTHVVTFGSSRPLSLGAVTSGPWPSMRHLAHPLDPVPLVAPDGTGQVFWRTPGELWLVNDIGMSLVTQQPSTAVQILNLLAQNGDAYHSTLSYDYLLSNGSDVTLPVGGALIEPFGGGPMNIWNVVVRGEMLGQSVVNVLSYIAESPLHSPLTFDANTVLDAFRERWRTYILLGCSQTYSVVSYLVRKAGGAQFVDPSATPIVSNIVYTESAVANGTSNDVGGQAGPVFPSFVAVGAQKACGPWLRNDTGGTDEIPLSTSPKGGIRIAGTLEADTNTLEHKLNAAALSVWTTRISALTPIPVGGNPGLTMAVTTTRVNGATLFDPGVPPTAFFAAARVNSLAVNPYMTSQVSRKQRLSRLG